MALHGSRVSVTANKEAMPNPEVGDHRGIFVSYGFAEGMKKKGPSP